MSNPTATRGRVLLGATGDGDDWRNLRAFLLKLGCQISLFDAASQAGDDGLEAVLPRPDGVDQAIVVVAGTDRPEVAGETRRLAHLIGVLRGRYGERGVIVLQEADLDSFLSGTGISELRYEPGNIRARFGEVAARLSEGTEPSGTLTTPWVERFGISEGALASEAWLILGVLAVVAALLFAVGVPVLGRGGREGDGAGATTVATVGSALGSDTIVAAPGTFPGGAGQPGADRGSVAGLPARCTIDTGPGVVLPAVIDCEGVGGVRVDGDPGPWHEAISAVTMDLGVVGTASMVSTAATGGDIPLDGGQRQSLEPYDPQLGVTSLVFEFSANGQRVALHQNGGDDAVMVFALDL
ncbi:MAG: hypothetical protein ACFCVK_22470 [Acidimicrobiales bacterium]